MIIKTEFDAELAKTGFDLTVATKDILIGYLEMLMHWNKAMNLVGTHTWQTTLSSLLVDSFYLADFISENIKEPEPICWDLGAGAGLPGIALRAVWPKGQYIMVEAREKRALFLSNVLARYPLPNTNIYHGRVEKFFAKPENPSPHIILSRAFMPWRELVEKVKSYLLGKTVIIFLTNEKIYDNLLPKIEVYGQYYDLKAVKCIEYKVENSKRYIWTLEMV